MKLVYIDNYDSFANTIKAHFKLLGAEVVMYKSDTDMDVIKAENPDMIILGPGGKSPAEAGNYLSVIKEYKGKVPMRGICLGMQSLFHDDGMPVERLKNVIHGQYVKTYHTGKGFFQGAPEEIYIARYNSLGFYDVPDEFEPTAITNDNMIMGARHKTLDIEVIQGHPESFLSSKKDIGMLILKNMLNAKK